MLPQRLIGLVRLKQNTLCIFIPLLLLFIGTLRPIKLTVRQFLDALKYSVSCRIASAVLRAPQHPQLPLGTALRIARCILTFVQNLQQL